MTQNRRYQKLVTMHRPEGLMLEVDVISLLYPTEQVLYSVPLARLTIHELKLDNGRFDLYHAEPQEFHVREDFTGQSGTLTVNFVERLNWVSENATDTWSFDLEMGSVHEANIIWSFKDLSNALMFRLTF